MVNNNREMVNNRLEIGLFNQMESRGSLAWLGRQTHNLERQGTRRPIPEVAGSNPAPGTMKMWMFLIVDRSILWCLLCL